MDTPVSARAALLQALTFGPDFGLQLIACVKHVTGGHIELGQGSIYPALRALESEGLIRSFDGEPRAERGGRPRRYYELTKEGWSVAAADRVAVLALFFSGPARRRKR